MIFIPFKEIERLKEELKECRKIERLMLQNEENGEENEKEQQLEEDIQLVRSTYVHVYI